MARPLNIGSFHNLSTMMTSGTAIRRPTRLLLALLLLVLFHSSITITFTFTLALSSSLSPPARLQQLLEYHSRDDCDLPLLLPCCYDGLTARLVTRAGFDATFMTGFGVSAARGYPDTQLISSAEMQQSALQVSEGLASAATELQCLPPVCIADGDTGYGNSVNVKRTVWGYARAGMAGVMIEDQVAPKRCGHVVGKSIVPRAEAISRIQAACDARDEYQQQFGVPGPLILARTDALKTDGIDEALERLARFRDVGCDMTFLEAPRSIDEMQLYCATITGPKLANMLEYGSTPILHPKELKSIGYTMAAYPLTLLSASIRAMESSLARLKEGKPVDDLIMDFSETKDVVGFTLYGQEEERYKVD
jgi:2-methylisocitrate lyase-like PEP mutase family enzyme